MAERFIIDSSAAIKYLNNSLPVRSLAFSDKELDKEINISIITKVEILAWDPPDPSDLIIARKFTDGASIFPVDDNIGDIAVSIRKATKVKLPDVLIAATAIVRDLTLVADNDKDFNKILELNIEGVSKGHPLILFEN